MNGRRVIVLDKEESIGRLRQMESYLVARVLGNEQNTQALSERGKKRWRITGELKVKRMPNSLYLFSCQSLKRKGSSMKGILTGVTANS